jgi:hypothetical protein
MKRLLLALVIVAVPAHAFEWPWQHKQLENYSYCKGFVSAGLGAFPVQDLSRIQLWLSWNYVVHAQLEQGELVQEQYEAGRTRFSELLAANDLAALVRVANTDCDYAQS